MPTSYSSGHPVGEVRMLPRGASIRMTAHILITCPNCSQPLKVRGEYLGRRGTCKHCQAVITLVQSPEQGTQSAKAGSTHGTGTALWEPKPSTEPEQNLNSELDRLKLYISSITKERLDLRSGMERAQAELADARTALERLEPIESELRTTRAELTEAKSKADQLTAELDAANQGYERLRDELQAQHEAEHQETLSKVQSHRLEAETWKARHDEKDKESVESLRSHTEESHERLSEFQRLTADHEALKTQITLNETSHRDEAEAARTRSETLEHERNTLLESVNEARQRIEGESQARQAAEAAAEALRSSLAAVEANLQEHESATIRELQNSAETLELRLKEIATELDATNARRIELESALAKRIEDAEGYQREISRAKEFKEQIRTFLTGLGINLPEA